MIERDILYKTFVVFVCALGFQDHFGETKKPCEFDEAGPCDRETANQLDPGTKYAQVGFYLCDLQTDGGGWIVFQRRIHKDISFYRNWTDYKYGFGNVCTDYYLGNHFLATLTKKSNYELRIDMKYNGQEYFAQYETFKVLSEIRNYTIQFDGYSGNIDDDFGEHHNNNSFSTYDRDNDKSKLNCAKVYKGGWWYHDCHLVNLNGEFGSKVHGLNWHSLTLYNSSVSFVEMKMRRVDSK